MRTTTDITESIRPIVEHAAGEVGLELVEIVVRRARSNYQVRIDIDRAGPVGVTLDDCQHLSQVLGPRLDDQDTIPGSYVLEVSSPGLDRPITTAADIRRNTGRRVSVLVREPAGGERAIDGVLMGSMNGSLRIATDDGEVDVAMDRVLRARQAVAL
jgi:ribosome maturation factor RimP